MFNSVYVGLFLVAVCILLPAPILAAEANRDYYGDLTWYNLGLTACGRTYTDNDYVVALAFGHFTASNPNHDPICGKKIRIVDPSSHKSVVVRVEDQCAGCKMSDVDVSPIAFKALRPLDVGRFKVNWSFI